MSHPSGGETGPVRFVRACIGTHRLASERNTRDESGAVLILAMIFTLIISVTILALLGLGSGDLLNTSNLKDTRNLSYAADGATTVAVQSVRYTYYAYDGSSGPSGDLASGTPCNPTAAWPLTVDGYQMVVDCAWDTNETYSNTVTTSQTRWIDFYTCPYNGAASLQQGYCVPPAEYVPGGAGAPALLVATVVFDDYNEFDVGTCGPGAGNQATCGSGQTVNSWIVENANS